MIFVIWAAIAFLNQNNIILSLSISFIMIVIVIFLYCFNHKYVDNCFYHQLNTINVKTIKVIRNLAIL